VVERAPLTVSWGGFEVHTMPPPSAGGLLLVQALKLYTPLEIRQLGDGTPALQHALAEAFRGSISDRMRYLGDPAFEAINIAQLTSDSRLRRRRESIGLNRTHALPRFGLEEHGTHHLVTADAEGNLVALTTTVNRGFGAKLMAPQSGVLLNDELDDFTGPEGVAPFGMAISPNRARGGARPVSSMNPTIVTRAGRGVLAIGGSGGTTIATNTAQLVISHLVFGTAPERLVAQPRFQIPTSGGASLLVPAETTPAHRADLERRGEVLSDVQFTFSGVQAVAVDAEGRKLSGADPRKNGRALVH
jgi:gamma-glutamyltranspeptidase/glutathione hydrolase